MKESTKKKIKELLNEHDPFFVEGWWYRKKSTIDDPINYLPEMKSMKSGKWFKCIRARGRRAMFDGIREECAWHQSDKDPNHYYEKMSPAGYKALAKEPQEEPFFKVGWWYKSVRNQYADNRGVHVNDNMHKVVNSGEWFQCTETFSDVPHEFFMFGWFHKSDNPHDLFWRSSPEDYAAQQKPELYFKPGWWYKRKTTHMFSYIPLNKWIRCSSTTKAKACFEGMHYTAPQNTSEEYDRLSPEEYEEEFFKVGWWYRRKIGTDDSFIPLNKWVECSITNETQAYFKGLDGAVFTTAYLNVINMAEHYERLSPEGYETLKEEEPYFKRWSRILQGHME